MQTEEKESTKNYKKKMHEKQVELAEIASRLKEAKRSMILVFEGLDASGKSGCIRRLTRELDMKQFRIIPISKPTDEEYRYHYLKRFFDALPPYGNLAFFDRSWYGRVLVERIEGFAKENEWQRAYAEINTFEKMLTDDGTILCKLWFEVSEEEQLKRFRSRQENPEKQHKITEEDWRNRTKREEYDLARDDMLHYTNKPNAPWIVIDGNNKKSARLTAADKIISYADLTI